MNLNTLIPELNDLSQLIGKWADKNFPCKPEELVFQRTVLGQIEEIGELSHSILKRDQGIRGSRKKHDADIRDAIADIVIFCLHGCYAIDYKLSISDQDKNDFYFNTDSTFKLITESSKLIGKYTLLHDVAHIYTYKQIVERTRIPERLIVILISLSELEGFYFRKNLLNVASKVLQRNWVTNPLSANEDVSMNESI